MSSSDILVFDAEPLIAYFLDEDGAEVVEQHLERVRDGATGLISAVNITEVLYITAGERTMEMAEVCIKAIRQFGIEVVECIGVWETAGNIKYDYQTSLADAYAVATVDDRGGTLIVGADDDYDDIIDDGIVPIDRFRTEAA